MDKRETLAYLMDVQAVFAGHTGRIVQCRFVLRGSNVLDVSATFQNFLPLSASLGVTVRIFG